MAARLVLAIVLVFTFVNASRAQTVTWSDSFVSGSDATPEQCSRWYDFLQQLTGKSFASVTLSGTYDASGITINDPAAATQLASLLSSHTPGSVTSGGHTWTVAMDCGTAACINQQAVTLSVDGNPEPCSCDDTYSIRPHGTSGRWGGINTPACSSPDQTMQLVFHSGVTIIVGGPTEFCPGESVVLTADANLCSGPYTFQWSNGATTSSITVTESGTYSVTVISADGCSGTSSAVEVSVSSISVDAGPDLVYCDEPVQLSASVSGGASTEVVNKVCLFDSRGAVGNCAPVDNLCALNVKATFHPNSTFSSTVNIPNPSELRFQMHYSNWAPLARFVFKVNGQQVGLYEDPVATGACQAVRIGTERMVPTVTVPALDFLPYWNNNGDNVISAEVSGGNNGVLLGVVSAEVVSSNESFSWSPAAGLNIPFIAHPLASPTETTVYTVTYTDASGCAVTDQVEVEVNCNTAPVIVCQPLVVSADANCQAIVEATAFDGGSTSQSGGALTFSVSPSGPYAVGETEVTLTATDENGESSSCVTTVTVNDTSLPVLTTSGDIVVANDEGTCSATVDLTQPEVTDNCGIASISHDQTTNVFPVGETIVTWTATDIHGNVQTAAQKVIVTNDDPVIHSVTASSASVEINTPVSIAVLFTDNNIQSATIDWGDLSAPDVIQEPSADLSVTHAFAAAGSYAVSVTLTDRCGGVSSFTYESITVLAERDGYVKGGGWFDSRRGYYVHNHRAEGKAQFSFQAEYPEGSDVPVGSATFRFKGARLQFRSTGFDMLIVDGDEAFLTGNGTLNGKSGYGILISMVDGDLQGDEQYLFASSRGHGKKGKGKNKTDRIRVKIWDPAGSVVYDTQSGAPDDSEASTYIGGGSIQIGTRESEDSDDDVTGPFFGDESTAVYPNPFADQISVQFNNSSEEQIQFYLMDLAGRAILSEVRQVSMDGSYSFSIPDERGGPGIYILVIRQGRRVEFVRLVRE